MIVPEMMTGQRRARQTDAAEVRPFGVLLPARRKRRGIEVQVGTVVADEKVLWRLILRDDRQQRRALDTLHEAQIEPGLGGSFPQGVAKAAVADRSGKRTAHAERGNGASDVPGRAAGFADPVLAFDADHVGQGLSDGDETRKFGAHLISP